MIPTKESYERLPIGFWLRTTGWRQIDPAKFTVENWERDWTDGGSTVWKATPIFLFVGGNIPKIRVSYFIVAALMYFWLNPKIAWWWFAPDVPFKINDWRSKLPGKLGMRRDWLVNWCLICGKAIMSQDVSKQDSPDIFRVLVGHMNLWSLYSLDLDFMVAIRFTTLLCSALPRGAIGRLGSDRPLPGALRRIVPWQPRGKPEELSNAELQ